MYVAGEWTTGDSEATTEATNPATGEVIGTVPEGTREDVRRAIAAAGEAWPIWAARSAFERAAAMGRIADIIEERRHPLAWTLTLDQGKPLLTEAYDEVDELVQYFRMAVADATRLAVTADIATPSVSIRASRVLAWAFRKAPLTFEKASSIGL
jgi:succinate-semialdehyde dehydrogenase/glutarate-semialdehyde dehydrogenase